MHCHRLNHEDNGLMTLVNVIPEVSTYAVAVQGSPGRAAEVKVYDGNGDRLIATVTPFPGFEGALSVAMGDVNDDNVLDLIVGAGENHAPMVVAYSGKATGGKAAFETQIARFAAFDPSARGGVSVTAAQIDGTTADNIIVGSGPGTPSEVRVFGTQLPSSLGTAPPLFSTFTPYANDSSGVSVASGFVDFATGRYSIITAPGPGTPTQVKVFTLSLMKPLNARPIDVAAKNQCPGPKEAAVTAAFMPFGIGYSGGVSLATGWVTGSLGRRRGDHRRPAERPRNGEGLFERLGATGWAEGLFAKRRGAHAGSHLHRHRAIQAVRSGLGGTRRHDQHDGRRRPPPQRRVADRPNRKGSQVPARQANRRG